MYHNKVNLSLTPVKRLGNLTHNCKVDYYAVQALFENSGALNVNKNKVEGGAYWNEGAKLNHYTNQLSFTILLGMDYN